MYFTQEDLLKIERYLKLNSKKDTDFPISTDALSNLDLLVFIKDNSNKRVAFQKVLEAAFNYITNDVYTKSEVYNKTEVYTQSLTLEAITGAIQDLGVLGFEILPNQSAMDSLLSKCNNQSDTDYPDYGINASKYTYLIPNSTTSGDNRYDEYIILRHGGQAGTPYSFTSENIGVRSIDLTEYVKKEEGKGLSTNDFNNPYKLRLDALNPNSISKEIYYNSCIKELNITDPNYEPPRDSSDPEGAYEGDKYYLVALYKGTGNSSGASIIITKNGTDITTDTVCQLWVSKSNYGTNPNTNSPFVNIPEKVTDDVGSGVNAKALIVWNNVFYNNRFAAASLEYGSYGPYEIPVTCVNNNANDSYLRNSITNLGEYNIELDNIHRKDTEILLQKFEGYKGEYYRKSGHDLSLMVDVSDSTFKSHPIKIQLYPIPDEEYTLKLQFYPGTPYNPGTILGDTSIDSDNYIVNYTINNSSCNTIKILKDISTNVDEAIIYTYDTSSLNERINNIKNTHYQALVKNNLIEGDVVLITGGSYIKFDIDDVLINHGEDVIFYTEPNKEINIQVVDSQDTVIAQTDDTISSDANGYYILPATWVTGDNRAELRVRTSVEYFYLTTPSVADIKKDVSKLKKYRDLYITTGYTLEENAIYENCTFISPDYSYDPTGASGSGSSTGRNVIYLSNGVTLRDCFFVNTLLRSGNATIKDCVIEHCHFVGQGSTCYTPYAENLDILYNEFEISHPKFPDATDRTKSEESRNIYTRTINHCRIIGNHIYKGRTGILMIGGGSDDIVNNNHPNISSEYNVIKNNIIEGVGEEYISFDGGACFDVGQITSIEVTLDQEETDQGKPGDLSDNQTKYVAVVQCSIASLIQNTTGYSDKHVQYYPTRGDGWYVVNTDNGEHFKMDSYSLTGTTALDAETQLNYSVNGTYQLLFRVPTPWNYKDDSPIELDPESADVLDFLAHIEDEWTDKIVYIGAMQNYNTISGNTIKGIGTDKFNDIEEMGGIVLYGMCFNNTIIGNSFNQRRIWLLGWNVLSLVSSQDNPTGFISKIKMQCFNTIQGNTLYSSGIGILNFTNLDPIVTNGNMCQGNILIGNKAYGARDVSSIKLDSTKDTQAIGNSAYNWTLLNNTNFIDVGNIGIPASS